MFQGLMALFGRSLRIDSRSWQVHLARLGLMVAIYIALAFALATSSTIGAPGLRFFRSIVWLNVVFMTLLGIGFFSTAISEEKEEDTLGLMQMAGINPLGILLGKAGGRLCQALLLIAVQYPFTLLAVTMGGVSTDQVRCAFAGLVAFMILMAGGGLLCSTLAPRNRTASSMMLLGLVAYFAIPYAAYELYRFLTSNGLIAHGSMWTRLLWNISSCCLFLQVSVIMTTGFGESPFSIQVLTNTAGGVAGFLAAWGLFSICTRNPSSEPSSRGMLSRSTRLRWFSPGRPGSNPFVWKDYYFVGGGNVMILVRFGLYLALMAVVCLLGIAYRFDLRSMIGMYQVLALLLLTLESAVLTSRTLHEEVRGQTLATLVMLPSELLVVVYSKFLGALLTSIPGVCCLALACLFTPEGRRNTGEFLEAAAGWFFLSHFLLVPHVAAVTALYLRWGCVPLGIGVGMASLFGWVFIFETSRVGQYDAIVWFAVVVLTGLSAACHVWIAIWLPRVAARG